MFVCLCVEIEGGGVGGGYVNPPFPTLPEGIKPIKPLLLLRTKIGQCQVKTANRLIRL